MRKAEMRRLDFSRYGAAVVAAAALYPGLAGPDLWRFPAGVVCGAALTKAVRAARQARSAEARRAQARLKVAAMSATAGELASRPDTAGEPEGPSDLMPAAAPEAAGTGRRRRAGARGVEDTTAAEDTRAVEDTAAAETRVEETAADEPVPGGSPAREPAPARGRRSESAARALPRPKDRRRKADVPGARRTEDALRALAREGWVIRPDVAPAFHGIAHVAIGPPGVFLLDSSNWDADIERHEALLNRAVVEGHRLRLVAAGRVKLRAA